MLLTILHTVTHAAASIFILLLLRENRKLLAVNTRNAREVIKGIEESKERSIALLRLRDEVETMATELRSLRASEDKAAKRSESMEILRLEKELREAKRGKA